MSYISAARVGNKVRVWERHGNRRKFVDYDAPYYFYVEDPKGDHESIFGQTCSRVDFTNAQDFSLTKAKLAKSRVKLFESDISSELKVLSEHYYNTKAPTLNITYIDIEVDYNPELGFASAMNPYAPINSVAMYHSWLDKIVLLAVPPETWGTDPRKWEEQLDKTLYEIPHVEDIIFCESEEELLLRLLHEIQDSDGICGWNSDFFDSPYICKRLEKFSDAFLNRMSFEGAPEPRYREVEIFGKPNLAVSFGGRLNMDYLQLFKKFEMSSYPSYSLEAISEDVLPDLQKLEYEGSLATLYRDNFNFFMRYNIRDVECLKGFEEDRGYVALAVEMFHSATGLFDHIYGTIKLADCSITNYAHYELGKVVPDFEEKSHGFGKAQGAFVLKPKAGFHKWIGSVDINSLYPSAIRAVNISPETLMGQFENNVMDFEALNDPSMAGQELTLTLTNGHRIKKTAAEWDDYLRSKKWAVSGYGTVYTQEFQGILPAILENWYAIRKQFQKMKAEATSNTDIRYYDRLQYCYKIKLNSLYGALLNQYFRYYDPRLGESTTGSGRAILSYMCAKVNECLTGEFNNYGDAVIYGDTDSCYFQTFAEAEDEAVIIADAVADRVNDSFREFVADAFRAVDGFNHLIKAGREVVAESGIFVTPKRYMLQVRDDEGKKVDKPKVMGLDIKKTIIPREIQNKLRDFLVRLLKGEDWNVISADIVRYKESLMERDITFIGLPKGINGVEKYQREVDMYGENVRVPGHVRGALYYNQLLKEHNDKESMPISSDMKIRLFYLKTPKGKYKSIAIPRDIEVMPSWFFDIEIDKEKQIERLVDNPLKNILKAIGKEPPTHRSLLVEESFDFSD